MTPEQDAQLKAIAKRYAEGGYQIRLHEFDEVSVWQNGNKVRNRVSLEQFIMEGQRQ